MNQKKYAVWAAAGIAVLAGIIVFCVLAFGGSAKAKELEEQLSLANRYLQELDYENAVAAFQSALEIEPKSEEAYLGLADAYVGLGDYEAALQALTEGIERTQSEALRAKLSEVEALAGISGADSVASDREAQAEGGRNAYGAVVFEEREGYREFSELTAQEQELVETCVNAAVAHDGGLLEALAGTSDTYLLTKYGEYKVSVRLLWQEPDNSYPWGLGDKIPAALDDTVYVEVRPENGTGYWYHEITENGPVIFAEDYYYDGIDNERRWVECPCTDWQWNGSINGGGYTESEGDIVYLEEREPDVMDAVTEIRKSTHVISCSASMGLLQGDYVDSYQMDIEERYEDQAEPQYSSSSSSNVEHYEDGWSQLDEETWSVGNIYGRYAYTGERVDDLADLPEDVLEELFW